MNEKTQNKTGADTSGHDLNKSKPGQQNIQSDKAGQDKSGQQSQSAPKTGSDQHADQQNGKAGQLGNSQDNDQQSQKGQNDQAQHGTRPADASGARDKTANNKQQS